MDTVTFVVTPAINNGVILLFAVISLVCYSIVYLIADKVFYEYKQTNSVCNYGESWTKFINHCKLFCLRIIYLLISKTYQK